MHLPLPAILTVSMLATCGLGFSENPPAAQEAHSGAVTAVSSTELPSRIEADRGQGLLIRTLSGSRKVGPWKGFDLEHVHTGEGVVPWVEIVPADRLRLGRTLIRASGTDAARGWALLVAALELSAADEVVEKAREALVRVARDRAPDLEKAIRALVDDTIRQREESSRSLVSAAIPRTRPHLDPDRVATWPPSPTTPRTPADVESARAALRSAVEDEVEGLARVTVPTALVLVTGPGTLDDVAATGVAIDRMLAACRGRLRLQPSAPPAGGLAVIQATSLDEARVLAARHRLDWPANEASLLVPRSEGLVAIVPPPADDQVSRWMSLVPVDAEAELLAEVELARVAARSAMLEAGRGRVPAWMLEGFAESSAQALVPSAPLERLGRPPAVVAIRAGRHPGWIVDVDAGDEAWAPDGLARRTAHLLVTRILEWEGDPMPAMIRDLAVGKDLDEVFRRRLGLTVSDWFTDCSAWYRTND